MHGNRLTWALALAFLGPAFLLGGALAFEYIGGMVPCELCLLQRWPHAAALLVALIAFIYPAQRPILLLCAAVAIAGSGAVAVYHAGVEWGLWAGATACTATHIATGSSADFLRDMIARPIIRCDVAPWSLFGLSMAGWNALLSFSFSGTILWLIRKK